MSKDDGSLRLGGETTPLMQLLLRRRSVRKYASGAATREQVAYIVDTAERFARRVGYTAARITIVAGDQMRGVVQAATSGLIGKANPWLWTTLAPQLILCGAVYPRRPESRPAPRERAIAEAAMTMQVAILAATELDLATCWLGAINHDRVEEACPLPDGARLVAISPLGRAPARQRLSWDTIAHHLLSKRRKPLEALRMAERWRDR